MHPAKLVFCEKSPIIVVGTKNSGSDTVLPKVAPKKPKGPKVLSDNQLQNLNTGKLHTHHFHYALLCPFLKKIFI